MSKQDRIEELQDMLAHHRGMIRILNKQLKALLSPASDSENYRKDWFDGCTGRDRPSVRVAPA